MAELYFKKINMKNLILFILFSIISIIGTNAQPLGSINIDQLSDQQLLQYMNSAGLSGLNESQLESKAKSKGLNNDQISKIKSRVSNLQTSQSVKTNSAPPVNVDRVLVPVITPQINYTENGVFGSELFTNTNLTFEPNLRIPTPVNYVLGVDDELVIDIFGYSENTYKLKVQPEGYIRMPNIGPVRVVGLPIEDARKKIKQQLQKIYPGILSGNTSVQISLGQIRTIRVTLIGEVIRPGTYSIPSLANIANALYVSGGPNANGSFRTIELIRNGKTKVIFDLYDFLIKGDLSNNLMLQDDDIIKINPYKIRVSVYGAVKKSAVFEAKENENLGSIITYANGFSDNVYKESFKVIRLGKTEKEILTIPFQEYLNFKIQSGDVIVLDNIIDRFKNRVSINGAVFHPGDYSTDNVTNLKQLILKAGLKEDAYRNRAIITRLQTDFTPTIINFNLNDILSEKQQITLQREDIVTITSVFSIREKYTVSINGEVGNSGSYDYRDSMKLKDLILLAGGFKESASGKKIEISRRIRNLNKPE
jgi:protein involved in polysaccharide export with SLBB domain